MQSLCTLRDHCRQWPRNTRYQAGATPYLGRTSTGWIAPACGWRTHSITSSARNSSAGEIVISSVERTDAIYDRFAGVNGLPAGDAIKNLFAGITGAPRRVV